MPERNIEKEGTKVYKRDILSQINADAGLPFDMIRAVYDSLWDVIFERLANGDTVVLNGIGVFSMKSHKGHKSYFKEVKEASEGRAESDGHLDNYYTLKFSPANVIKKRLRKEIEERMSMDEL